LEGMGLITKGEFDRVQDLINECRKKGILPIDFVAQEEARSFSGVEIPDVESPAEYIERYLRAILHCEWAYTPDWWEGESFYLQMVVEKIDLKTLFQPICRQFHIPIATSKGWSSLLQRAEYARRFQEAEERGLQCVLLYCGDHDPPGLQISDCLRKNLEDVSEIVWEDGVPGYDPRDLIIDRFGLNYDFIVENKLTWIENLKTGSGRDLADPNHPDFHKAYVQDYIRRFGVRKVEANAIVKVPEMGRRLCREAIEKYLGSDALERFREKREKVKKMFKEFRKRTGLEKVIEGILRELGE